MRALTTSTADAILGAETKISSPSNTLNLLDILASENYGVTCDVPSGSIVRLTMSMICRLRKSIAAESVDGEPPNMPGNIAGVRQEITRWQAYQWFGEGRI
jgi:hypothetical protein